MALSAEKVAVRTANLTPTFTPVWLSECFMLYAEKHKKIGERCGILKALFTIMNSGRGFESYHLDHEKSP